MHLASAYTVRSILKAGCLEPLVALASNRNHAGDTAIYALSNIADAAMDMEMPQII